MSLRRRRCSALSAVAEADSGLASGVSDKDDASKRHCGEGARRHLSVDEDGDLPSPHVDGSEHGHALSPAVDEERAATTGHEEHLPDSQPRGATTPRSAQLLPIVVRQLPARALTSNASFCSGVVYPSFFVTNALENIARRILPFANGDFSPSPPPHVLDKLTDEILVHASDAVAAVGASVSGKARYRLLAWTVADARGAQVVLERALAETVGKRLERQADRVRGALTTAADIAEESHASARAAAAGDAVLMANLPTELDRIDSILQAERERATNEVYIGFTELETLVKPPPSVESEAHESCTVSRYHMSTQTECQPEAVVSSLLDATVSRLSEPDDWRGVPALLQSAMDHIVTLDGRLDALQRSNESLRAEVVSERFRADQAKGQLSEAERHVDVLERQLAEQDERNEEVASENEATLQWELTASRREADQLRAEVRGLRYELALLKQ